jgi:ribosomal protein L29
MKTVDLKKKNKTDLGKLLIDKKKALQNFRFNISGSKTRNVKEGKALRKEIARILAEVNSRKE